MCDLVHNSNLVLTVLAGMLLLAISAGTLGTEDEAAWIASVCVSNSIAYLPYFFAVYITTRVDETSLMKRVVVIAAILFRLLAFTQPPVMSDDTLRYRWEARQIEAGRNPYRVSPADVKEPDRRVPGYDFSAVYGPVIEGVHFATYKLGLPMKASACVAEAVLLLLLWRRVPLSRWVLVAWSPLMVFEFWINGHNDAWLVLLLYLALVARGWAAWVWLGLATLTKWWPVLLVPLWLRADPSLWGVAAYASLLGSCLGLMPWSEWVTKVRYTTGFMGGWQNNAFLYRVMSDKMQAMGVAAVASVSVPWLRLSQVNRCLVLVTVFLAVSANIHPWYLAWLMPMLALSEWDALPWLLPMALLPLAYDPMIGWRMNGTWVEDMAIRNWIWCSVMVFSAYRFLRRGYG